MGPYLTDETPHAIFTFSDISLPLKCHSTSKDAMQIDLPGKGEHFCL